MSFRVDDVTIVLTSAGVKLSHERVYACRMADSDPPTPQDAPAGSPSEYRFATGVRVFSGSADPLVYLDFWQGSPDATAGQGIARLVIPRDLARALAEQLSGLPDRF